MKILPLPLLALAFLAPAATITIGQEELSGGEPLCCS
jgi:hypothetical protein